MDLDELARRASVIFNSASLQWVFIESRHKDDKYGRWTDSVRRRCECGLQDTCDWHHHPVGQTILASSCNPFGIQYRVKVGLSFPKASREVPADGFANYGYLNDTDSSNEYMSSNYYYEADFRHVHLTTEAGARDPAPFTIGQTFWCV